MTTTIAPPITHHQLPTALPPIKCKPWCAYGCGHADEFAPEDQWCGSACAVTPLSLYGLERYSPADASPVQWKQNYLEVYLHANARTEGQVMLREDITDSPIRMTADEARTTALSLLLAAQILDGQDSSTPEQSDVDAVRELFDLMETFSDNDQRARYLLASNWLRDRGAIAGARVSALTSDERVR